MTEFQIRENEPYAEGRNARLAGADILDNPYPYDVADESSEASQLSLEWSCGWRETDADLKQAAASDKGE